MNLFGASGHAKVVIDILRDNNKSINQIFDDNESVKELMNFPVQLPNSKLITMSNDEFIITIGDNTTRYGIAHRYVLKYGIAIHPRAILAPDIPIGGGTVIMANATINSSTRIGYHVIINTSSIIDHDCQVSDFAHISPGATLCGKVRVGEGVHIGAGAIILPGVKIGNWSIIGAGSVVLNNVPDHSIVVGNPGHILQKTAK
jgi:sugar O-acyltransferase (sialic acid O-acetyltransferase NeuD family)